jgi:SAM-dependent methyltransferase
MRNLLQERPRKYEHLHGRCRFCCDFVAPEDLRGREVLDIGCGFGWFERFAAARAPRRLVGIEPKESDLVAARSIAAETQAEFVCAGAFRLPFPEASFDTVCIWDVIEHVPRGREADLFREIYRVLRPEGRLYLSTPYRSFLAVTFDPAFWLIGHRHYSVRRLEALAAPSGLRLATSLRRGRVYELLAIINLYVCKWVLRRPPLLEGWLDRKQDEEYARDGYMTVFVRFDKGGARTGVSGAKVGQG